MLGANSDESALSCSVLPFLSTAVETCKYSRIPSWLTHILTKRKIALVLVFYHWAQDVQGWYVQDKLPWLNPHNVQKYKLFGVLKRLVNLKKQNCLLLLITHAHVVTFLNGFLRPHSLDLIHFHYVEKTKSCTRLERH